MPKECGELLQKVGKTISEEGIVGCVTRTKKFMKKQMNICRKGVSTYRDILFISGCRDDLPHPWRYRVVHQREQLEACGFTTGEVYFQQLSIDDIRYYRAFVFFRCSYTEQIGKFILIAKQLNKKLIYDIDDLVIDTIYTDQIPYVRQMDVNEKAAYDANVMNMGRLLKLCDMATTTTACLAEELKKYVPNVMINRNTASEEMIALSRKAYFTNASRIKDKVRIGYFSGSITHNADIEMILPALVEVLEKYPQVELCFVGEIDLPNQLEKYRSRIEIFPFGSWKKLPEMIAQVDINLAPLENTIFNCAKSENKWVEAALVKVVTVASDVGAFHDCINDRVNGILCHDIKDWICALSLLIEDKNYRLELANRAYNYCKENCTTVKNAKGLVQFFKKEIPYNYGFILPGLEISGGMKVALKHASILQKSGRDVTLFTLDNQTKWYIFEEQKFPVLSLQYTKILGNIGCAIATMWTTVEFVEQYWNIGRRCYLVQNYETDFYEEGNPYRVQANRTYMPHNNIEFITISRWCQMWLKDLYDQNAVYVPNGIETKKFFSCKRKMDGKIRILIEGDCAVDYKNIDESFSITNSLDTSKYEVWYMSYNAQPKEWYRIDKFLHKVPYEDVPAVYAECDVLLKTSLLESFSYPPLEMMASGGYVLAVPNGGNAEYLKNEYNCLLYPAGNYEKARIQLDRICNDQELQDVLYENGKKTASKRDWEAISKEILSLYLLE